MILLVQEGCTFCEQFKDIPGLVITKVIQTPDGPRMNLDGHMIHVPVYVEGFPLLLADGKKYVGRSAVGERLEQMRSAV